MISGISHPLFIVDGSFGTEVADYLQIAVDSRVSQAVVKATQIARGSVVVSIGDSPSFGFRDALDAECARRGIPSVGMHLTATRIVCGPAVIPGRTACFACYRARMYQHAAGLEGYDEESANQGLEPGFGNHHVVLASGLLQLALRELRNGPFGLGATIRTANLVSGALSQASVTAVNRCDRCGSRFREARSTGTVPDLHKAGAV